MNDQRALILEDNEDFIDALRRAFRGRMEFLAAGTLEEAKRQLGDSVVVALVDLYLHGQTSGHPEGLDFLRWVANEHPALPVIVITGYGNTDLVVEAMRLGADDFIDKGRLNLKEIEKRIQDAIERRCLRKQVRELEHRLDLYEPRQLIGESRLMQDLRRVIQTVAQDGEITAMLRGETGTGKELAARMIHAAGKRSKGAFIAVDLSTLPRETVAGELFGTEKGAYTGASSARAGFVEAANDGVLFLDEIAELSKDLQSRLFRVLEERAVTRLGSTRPRPVNIQLVTATNQDLEDLVRRGEFRSELYYRLRVFEIRLPALREHPEDIPSLVDYFLAQWRLAGRTSLIKANDRAIEVMQQYRWPGNIRELRNTLESASVRAKVEKATVLDLRFLPAEIRANRCIQFDLESTENSSLEQALAEAELRCVARALEAAGSQKERARELLGYGDRHTMRRRLLNLRRHFPQLWKLYPVLESSYGVQAELAKSRKGRPVGHD
jgi:DNA-binding NtrC family response regulator